MKRNYIVITFIALFFNLQYSTAQLTEIYSGEGGTIKSAVLKDKDIYLMRGIASNEGIIYKYDITESLASEFKNSGLSLLDNDIAFKGNNMYLAKSKTIVKMDITDPNKELITVYTNDSVLTDELVFNGNDLYIEDYLNKKLFKIDVTDSNPTSVEIVNDVNITDMLFIEDELYITIKGKNKIFKIDVNNASPTMVEAVTLYTDPSSNYISSPRTFTHKDGVIYLLQDNKKENGDEYECVIYKVDITEANPTVTEFYNLGKSYGINDMFIDGDDIYLSEVEGIIFKLSISEVLSTNTFENKEGIKLYPNPSANNIKISGIQETKSYRICNLLGATVLEGEVSQNQYINIKSLEKGLYIIKFEGSISIKFMKK